MIVLDSSVLLAYLGGARPARERAASAMSEVAGEVWAASPLALAEVLAPAAAASSEALDRVRHVLGELKVMEVDLTSHAAVILGRLQGETGLPLAAVGTLQLAIERDAIVVTLDADLQAACEARGLQVTSSV